MNDAKRLFWNTLAQVVGKAITVVASLFIIVALTRYLGPASFGDYSTIFAYLGIVVVFVDLGLFIVSVRRVAQEPDRTCQILTNLLWLKSFLGVVVFGVAVLLVLALPHLRWLVPALSVAAVSELLASLSMVPVGYLQARLLMPLASLSDVLGRLLNLGLVLWIIQWQLGLPHLIGAVLAGNLLVFGLNLFWARGALGRVRIDLRIWRELFRESIPLGIVLLLAVIYFRIDSLMLYLMKGSHEAGLYSASYKVLEVLLAFPSLFGASVFALMSAYFKESLRKVENLFRRAFEVNVIFVLPIALGVLVVAVPIILLVSGSQFLPSASALKILAFALIGSYLNSVMIYTLLAAGRQKIMVAPYLLATFFNVVTNFIFIPRFGFIGASLTTVATEFLVLSYTWFLVQRELHFRLEWRIPLKALLSSLFMLILLLSLPKLSLLEAILVGGGVYFALLWGMRGLDPRWLRLIFNR